MPHATGLADFNAIARRGLALAERRLMDLSEIYRSGRWVHYYPTKQHFAQCMLDAIKVAKVWARLADMRGPAHARKTDMRSAA
jgi:hypothetical protein